MTYFNILGIQPSGEVKNPMVMGQHSVNFDISKIGLEKFDNDVHFLVEVDYEQSANNQPLFRFKVATKWLILGLDKNDVDKEGAFLRHLIIRSVSHFNGVLSTKMTDNGWAFRLPDDPNLNRAFELSKNLMLEYSKS